MPKWIEHFYPLRPGFDVKLIIPVDLTANEANRLKAFLLAVADLCDNAAELNRKAEFGLGTEVSEEE